MFNGVTGAKLFGSSYNLAFFRGGGVAPLLKGISSSSDYLTESDSCSVTKLLLVNKFSDRVNPMKDIAGFFGKRSQTAIGIDTMIKVGLLWYIPWQVTYFAAAGLEVIHSTQSLVRRIRSSSNATDMRTWGNLDNGAGCNTSEDDGLLFENVCIHILYQIWRGNWGSRRRGFCWYRHIYRKFGL